MSKPNRTWTPNPEANCRCGNPDACVCAADRGGETVTDVTRDTETPTGTEGGREDLRALRDRIAESITGAIRYAASSDGTGTGPIYSDQLADAVMAVVQPELDRLTERIPYREGETEEEYQYRQIARWRSEAWQARGKLHTAEDEVDRLKISTQAETRAANQAEAAVARVRAALDAADWGGPDRGDVIAEIRAALDQPEGA